jgi:hypothetical protein
MSANEAMRRRAKTLLAQVDAILWTNWNPIGCAVPADEYTAYAGPIVRMLIESRPRAEIEAFLCAAYEQVRGEKTDGFGERLVVDKIMALAAPR